MRHYWQRLALLTGLLLISPPAWAETVTNEATAVEQQKQIAQTITQITGVRIDTTDGIAVILETTAALSPTISTVDNTLIADIPNAVLALPEEFQAVNPTEGITLVRVTNLPNNQVRVTITGIDAPPTVEPQVATEGLVLAVTPPTDDEEIQIVVTGELDSEGYSVPNATTATRTNTELRDIPQSIQVLPQRVLEDQQVNRLSEALRNVSGVSVGDSFGGSLDRVSIRGFQSDVLLQDGFRRGSFTLRGTSDDTELIERVEVLKGPASVLYGNLEPGGVVSVVTRQPQADPAYTIGTVVGSFGLVRPSIDLTGPLDPDQRLLYRFTALYEAEDGFRDYEQDVNRFVLAPSLTWNLSDRTALTFNFTYADAERPFDRGLPAIGNRVADVPRDRLFQDPSAITQAEELSASYRLTHNFNDNWQLRNSFRYLSVDTFDFRIDSWIIEDDGTLDRRWRSNDDYDEVYSFQTNVVGEFATGSVEHTLLAGVDFNRSTTQGTQRRLPGDPSFFLNIFTQEGDPISRPNLDDLTLVVRSDTSRENNVGLYLQDQITLSESLKILAGGRFDVYDLQSVDSLSNTEAEDTVQRFTPRLGVVYQPSREVSLYGSYSQAFTPNIFGRTADGSFLDPELSEQFEIGVRGEFADGRLIANLAAYNLTKRNVQGPDPLNPDFAIAVGEIRSRGIELDVTGEILPGWNAIASYAYTDAEVTEDNYYPAGNRPSNVPKNSASVWTTYEFQNGNLQGLGFGLGLFFVGERTGDFDNTYELPSYVRTDAALYYRRDNWRAALNFQNLFDVNYIRNSEGYREANAPGAPFTVIGSLSITF
ncbi:TonB-dependent siderophore receptor [Gloeocapsopsis crepidinum LEGE 06123]|uniref:TonB-dependent siderophore receptor n=1 Tax=Gloeocapsopsis crepidinum LEGE 06123 TaxID=588587 RepID=A0ABR9UUK7_9CHRO|nr:TonB-dependent siderophore receptor [Gloeocapsopsis crepidinum]MBE9190988.1 TonB-dependent siderophore receptor [Gloeocapsopsis crepidinum LEGE 06123]